jgi:tetratricopeptide (TPR) repeat protein
MYEQLEDNRRFLRGKTGKHFFLSNYYVASCIYITEYSKALDKLHVLRDKNKRKKIRLAAFEYYEGAIAIGENDIDKAKKCLEKINDLVKDINKGKGNKNSRDIVIGLTGLIALKEEDYEKAEALFSQRLIGRKDRISKMSLYYDLGLAKKGLGKEDEARKCFEKAAMYAGDARFELADKVREAYKAYDHLE